MKIKGILIKETGEIIYSRANHDFLYDSTKKYAVDGGQTGYSRTIFEDFKGFENVEFELDVTIQELYDDWNKSIDKLGRIDSNTISYNILKRS